MVQKNRLEYNCIIVLGPTASGKSDLALSLAKRYSGNIINCDSQQIYKDLSIGTAKPTLDEFNEVKHHLFDYIEIGEDYSVSRYYDEAITVFDQISSEGILPIFVGGTGFYIDSLLYKHDYGHSDKNTTIRDKYNKIASEKGNEYLFNLLKNVDPITAEKLHANDLKRVIRALEIAENGQLKSSQKLIPNDKIKPFIIHVDIERDELYKRINYRVDKMIELGLEKEVELLHKKGFYDSDIKLPIGYSEWKEYYANKLSKEETINLIKQHTRNYAKRQKTWFRRVICTMEYNPLHNTMQEVFNKTDKYFAK